MPDHYYPDWFPWDTSEYTLPAIREMRVKAEAEGYETRIQYTGSDLDSNGKYQSYGRLLIRSPRKKQDQET